MNTEFRFAPASFIPYKDVEVMERLRKMSREELLRHSNPEFKIKIVENVEGIIIADMVSRIVKSDVLDEKVTFILPNPWPTLYSAVTEIINLQRISCRNVHVFAMDEWANENYEVAPITWRSGLGYSMMNHFIYAIDEDLRMPQENVHYFTTQNVKDYSKMLIDCGEADICYSGPGWSGHLAFLDPGAKETECETIEEYLKLDARIVTLNPISIFQQSLHGCFGSSGYLASVPTKGATIGPRDVKNAKERIDMHAITVGGTFISWQRMTSRLVLHGPVTMSVPSSILQLMRTTVYLSEAIAAPFGPNYDMGY